ncbi:MAG: hypothetical protein AAFR03_04410 [Pseudomonadota bacterium]
MGEIRIGANERGRLKELADSVYAGLIVDRETDRVNDAQDLALTLFLFLFVILVLGAMALAEPRFNLSAELAEAVPALKDFAYPTVLIGPVVLSMPLVLWIRKQVSSASYKSIGRLIVSLRSIRPGSSDAKSSLNDLAYWFRFDTNRIAEEAVACSGKACASILPRRLTDTLGELRNGRPEEPFQIVRGLMERKYAFLYLANRLRSQRPHPIRGEEGSYFRLARAYRNSIKAAIVFNALGAEMRDESPNGVYWKREHFTKRDYQHVPFWDWYDLPLRFRTAGPHMRWPFTAEATSDAEMPSFRLLYCVENPCNLKLRVLTARDIIKEFPAALIEFSDEFKGDSDEVKELRRGQAAKAICLLANARVPLFGKLDIQSFLPTASRDAIEEPILRRLDGGGIDPEHADPDDILNADWGLRWDPNRIVLSKLNPSSDANLLQAIAVLTNAVNIAMRTTVTEVTLTRGDAIIIDNLRAVAARFEPDYAEISFWKRALGVSPEWWMRGYYGFRQSREVESDPEKIRFRDLG